MDVILNIVTSPKAWLALFFILSLTLALLVLNYQPVKRQLEKLPNPIPWLAEHYVQLLLPFGFVAIALAGFFWIWDIRGEIGSIVEILNGELKGENPSAENIRNLAYAIGALLAAVALSATIPFQLIKVWVTERLAKTTEQGHMTDRITKAVEQLGAEKTIWVDGEQQSVPNLEVRLGAIYALERIAQDSLRDHIPVMEILCAYVRSNAPAKKAKPVKVDYSKASWRRDLDESIAAIPAPPIDIQAILSVIGRRKDRHIKFEQNAHANPIKDIYALNLRATNLQKLDLAKAKLSNAMLNGSKIQGANLIGARLQKAILSYVGAQEVDFYGAEMQEATLIDAQFQGAHFGCAKMNHANFDGADTKLSAVRSTDLTDAHNLTDTQLEEMLGDSSTILPNVMRPPDWHQMDLDQQKFEIKWKSAKAAASV